MKILGIEFAPLNVPKERRLQTLAAAAWFNVLAFGPFVSLIVTVYLVVYTRLRWLTLIYLAWIVLVDSKTCERGGRSLKFMRNLKWWKYMRDYFPHSLVKRSDFQLDPKRNYIFACFPHGILPVGNFSTFGSDYGPLKSFFPHHTGHGTTLAQHFNVPFYRELVLGLGAVSASKESITHLAENRDGGKIISILIGGVEEAYFCRPGDYFVVLKKRKGFVKIALKTGCPLVPVFSFGEVNTFTQPASPPGSRFRRTQEYLRKVVGMAPILPIGRGFFQYSFGLIPRRHKVVTVIGEPIEVEKVENATNEQIDALHSRFLQALQDLFEQEKHKYEEKPDDVKLVIV